MCNALQGHIHTLVALTKQDLDRFGVRIFLPGIHGIESNFLSEGILTDAYLTGSMIMTSDRMP